MKFASRGGTVWGTLSCLVLICSSRAAAERKPADIAQDYFRVKAVSMRAGATPADIDKLLAFYTDDVIYEDPAVKVRIAGKSDIRSGMLSHVDDYAGSAKETRISMEASVAQANAVAVVITEVFWAKQENGRREIRRKRLDVLEFRGEQICRVIDYH